MKIKTSDVQEAAPNLRVYGPALDGHGALQDYATIEFNQGVRIVSDATLKLVIAQAHKEGYAKALEDFQKTLDVLGVLK